MVDSVKNQPPPGMQGSAAHAFATFIGTLISVAALETAPVYSLHASLCQAYKTQLLARLLQKLAWKFKKTCIKLTIFLALR